MNRIHSAAAVLLAAIGLVGCSDGAKAPSTQAGKFLEDGFVNPPQEAKPRVWWHWMNGNISMDGAMKDIDWMNRAGIGGFHAFDAGLTTPQIVENRITYMTPEWKEVFKASTDKAISYGMEMGIAGSPGWSESGGPWVEPKNGMKKLVWSETDVQGGKECKVTLPHPPTGSGSYGNFSSGPEIPEYYEEVAVVAFKTSSPSAKSLSPKVTSSGGDFTLDQLSDDDFCNPSVLPFGKPGTYSWIQYEFDEPQSVYGAQIVDSYNTGVASSFVPCSPDDCILEFSQDGQSFEKIESALGKTAGVAELTFPEVKAKYFRLSYKAPSPIVINEGMEKLAFLFEIDLHTLPVATNTTVSEFRLFTTPRISKPLQKAAYAAVPHLSDDHSPVDNIADSEVIDLTDKMDAEGNLTWTPGEGNWKVLRFGCSLTGHQNGPASPEATGLEVDKMDPVAVRNYFEHYLSLYEDATGGQMGEKGIHYIITDSWEAGCQNWSSVLPDEFKKAAGYDLRKWLPAVAGYVVGSAEESDKFLWDFRKVIGELIVKNHYDVLTDLLKERKMERYSESDEYMRVFTADGMEVKKNSSIPMSAMWVGGGPLPQGGSGSDIRESSSVAHLYGQKFVAAESLTTAFDAYGYCPENLKPTADLLMANGLNRFVIHESAHQPLDDFEPGFGLAFYGQWFNRHETWAEQAKAWTGYMARSCFMLSQGADVSDILYYYGEDDNITGLYNNALPQIPEGYNFDFVNADAIINDLKIEHGLLTSPSGHTYRALVIADHVKSMSLPVAKRLLELVKAGAVIVGEKPLMTPSLSDDPAMFQNVVDQIWNGEAKNGKGAVYSGSILDALTATGVTPDIEYVKPNENTKLLYVHRQYDGVQYYWLDSRTKNSEDIEVSFRVSGLEPELWNPVTGTIEKVSYKMENGRTTVKMHFDADDTFFIVFRSKASAEEYEVPEKTLTTTPVEGPWEVAFVNGMGAPEKLTFDFLTDWRDNTDKYIQYYSGTAVYAKQIELTADQTEGETVLSLGSVKNLAEVTVNGQDLGVVWKEPWKIDITSAVKEGTNDIEIKVVNLWVNRLIGDQRKDAGEYAHTTRTLRQAHEPLESSGLLGPVCIETLK